MTIKNLIAHLWDLWKNVLISGKISYIRKIFRCFRKKIFVFRKNWGMSGKFFDSQNGTLTENFLATGGGRSPKWSKGGVKSGRLTEGPQRLRYATGWKRPKIIISICKKILMARPIYNYTDSSCSWTFQSLNNFEESYIRRNF